MSTALAYIHGKEQMSVETITPAMAKKYLAAMIINRPLSQAKVLENAIAMDSDRWSLNGETIKFNARGELIDGQHRLHACLLAEKPFKTYVVRGLSDEHATATIDVGKTRSASDIFAIAGFTNNANVVAAANLLYFWQNRMLSWSGPTVSRTSRTSRIAARMKVMPSRSHLIDRDALLDFARGLEPGLSDALRYADSRRCKLVTVGTLTACSYLFLQKSEEDTDRFLMDLKEGVGLTSVDPVRALRERLINNAASGASAKLNRWTIFGMTIKAWNKRRGGERLTRMAIGAEELFPMKVI